MPQFTSTGSPPIDRMSRGLDMSSQREIFPPISASANAGLSDSSLAVSCSTIGLRATSSMSSISATDP